jgi:hypothetical protein
MQHVCDRLIGDETDARARGWQQQLVSARFAVVVPTRAQRAVLRVPPRVRSLLSVEVFVVSDEGAVSVPL